MRARIALTKSDTWPLKIAVCLGSFAFLFYISIPLHEFGHYLAAKIMFVPGSINLFQVSFGGGGGEFIPSIVTTGLQDKIIAFWGGGFVALILLILWLVLPSKRWYISVPLLGTVAWCLVVAGLELAWYF
ncbi:hypothetical protein ES708_33168 [subsurface metagenome]